jgi:fermentation-respiration switch protein FrsA (DUF1100 family)
LTGWVKGAVLVGDPGAHIPPPAIAVRALFSWALLLTVLTAMFAGCGIEEQLIFHPSATIARTPRQVGLEFEEVFFTAGDGVRLHGWFVPHRRARATLVWFHGNAGNISHRVDNIKLLHDKVNVHVFIFDYRGYGRSEGRVSEAGTYLDGEAALGYVRQRLGAGAADILLFGRSLGAAVATEIATRFDNQGLILESPFISIAEMARVVMPFLPIGAWLRTRYDVGTKIKAIRVPLLVLHGDRDQIIPFSQGKAVFAAAPQPKKFFTIAGASHNDTYLVGGESYFQELSDFVDWAKTRKDNEPQRRAP